MDQKLEAMCGSHQASDNFSVQQCHFVEDY